MKTQLLIIMVLLAVACPAGAVIVEIDLFDLGCPTEFDGDNQNWQTDFDLGVEFSSIDHVYMDWSGEIMAQLMQKLDQNMEPIGDPFSLDTGVCSFIKGYSEWLSTDILDGADDYPDTVLFECLSYYESSDWSDFYDGQGSIFICYSADFPVVIPEAFACVEFGHITLSKAKLVISGNVVPEPATIIFLGAGFIGIITRKRRGFVNKEQFFERHNLIHSNNLGFPI